MDINHNDASLHLDTYCYKCKKRIALSSAVERDGRSYCWRCADTIVEEFTKAEVLDQIKSLDTYDYKGNDEDMPHYTRKSQFILLEDIQKLLG